jgi:hypothetical protein
MEREKKALELEVAQMKQTIEIDRQMHEEFAMMLEESEKKVEQLEASEKANQVQIDHLNDQNVKLEALNMERTQRIDHLTSVVEQQQLQVQELQLNAASNGSSLAEECTLQRYSL